MWGPATLASEMSKAHHALLKAGNPSLYHGVGCFGLKWFDDQIAANPTITLDAMMGLVEAGLNTGAVRPEWAMEIFAGHDRALYPSLRERLLKCLPAEHAHSAVFAMRGGLTKAEKHIVIRKGGKPDKIVRGRLA